MPEDGRPIELKVFYICSNVKWFEVANAGQIIHPLITRNSLNSWLFFFFLVLLFSFIVPIPFGAIVDCDIIYYYESVIYWLYTRAGHFALHKLTK